MAGIESGGATAVCKRCGEPVAGKSFCTKCGLPSNAAFANRPPPKPLVPPPPPPPGHAVPPAPRAAGAVPPPPKPKTLPATPPAARPVSNKVACALCMQSMPRESAVAVDDAVAQSLGALSAPYKGKTLCPACLETLQAKAARAPAPSGEIPDLVAPAPSAAHSAPASPSASAASSRPAAGGAQPMPPHFWLAGGLAGALVGSAIYLGLHYGLDFRWAPVIILVGGLVGIGVRLGAQASTGLGPGAVAAVLTILTGFTTSYIISSGEAAEWRRQAEAEMENHLLAQIAYEILDEKDKQGAELSAAPLDEDENAEATVENEFPREVWQEAKAKWNGLAEDEKERRRHAFKGEAVEGESSMTVWGMIFEFRALFWFLIAAGTAYKAGAGS